MKNKLLSTLVATVMLFVSIPFMKPQQAEAWCWPWETEVLVTYKQCIGAVYVGGEIQFAWDVTFIKDGKKKVEGWRTYGWTADNEFGDSKLIQNMEVGQEIALKSSILNDPNKFSYGYRNK